jgi:hypothetical protein
MPEVKELLPLFRLSSKNLRIVFTSSKCRPAIALNCFIDMP